MKEMQKAYWILAIITMFILLIINLLMLIDKIKANKKKVEDTIVISLELDSKNFEKELKKVSKETDNVVKKTRKPRTKKADLPKE